MGASVKYHHLNIKADLQDKKITACDSPYTQLQMHRIKKQAIQDNYCFLA